MVYPRLCGIPTEQQPYNKIDELRMISLVTFKKYHAHEQKNLSVGVARNISYLGLLEFVRRQRYATSIAGHLLAEELDLVLDGFCSFGWDVGTFEGADDGSIKHTCYTLVRF
jgi:hypothetical protein